ncbi:MAG TPA: DUF4215 domain-containing protein, partial [Kofleriaceae bacterium]|nr:DUF4215 domain-containing protein [Kofleriaceae bacterium]
PLGSVNCSANCRSNLSCGNFTVDPGEECDNGNVGANNLGGNSDTADCRLDCQFNRCGDGVIDDAASPRHEECDGGHLTGLVPNPTETATCNIDCTRPHCGDGKLNRTAGEQCDDGNRAAGDGCSPDCLFERCGNGVVDPQEECDGTAGLLPCNVDTCFQERCGNGVLDDDNRTGVHEECDDHNIADNDGCSHDCKREFCGDGKTNDREPCDPTDPTFGAAGCNTDCTPSVCGDGKLDTAAGEQCDDGNTTSGDGCSHDCHLERCGNGILDPEEQCDGLLGLQPCNDQTCLQEICGNGVLDHDLVHGVIEQCDDGNLDDNDGCSHDCEREFCGDGIVNNGEVCDRALTPTTCNLDCTSSSCGDHKLNPAAGEQCDDGNTVDGDGCSAACTFEHCGNNVVDAGEECDGVFGLQPCSATCHQERCGNGILDNDLANNVIEQCDDGNLADNDGCSHDCKREFCGDGIVNNGELCDRALTPELCNLDCTPSICGDHKLDTAAGEQCDDGNTTSGDGCSATCTFEHCGNGVVDAGEECDGLTGAQPCSPTCHQERCGNGILDNDPANSVVEQCDDGNILDNDGCSHDCKREFCGDGIVNNGELCDRALTPASCNLDCTLSICGDHKLNAFAVPPEQCDDGNTTDGDGCSATCTFEHCGNGAIDAGEECDGIFGLQPCSATCHQERCGNGILDIDVPNGIAEQCDDGNTVGGDGCSATCTLERCGNGVLDPGEECDGAAGLQPCSAICRQERCGNGILDPGEQCDDGNTASGDGCSPSCTFERCGNGLLDLNEECDGLLGLQPCSTSCRQERCGNGILDVDVFNGVAEQCDLGPANSDTGACTTTCQLARCGDGLLASGFEQCDLGTGNDDHADCTTTCQPARCGDGLVDTFGPDHIEQCDLGAANTDNPACPYNAICTACSPQCTTLIVNHQCGDGVVDVPDEACDDHNTDACGSCSASCGTVTSQRAFGLILAVSGAELTDGETLILIDGVNPPTVFEFDTGDGVATGHVAVVFGAADTAEDVRLAIQVAIQQQHDAGTLLIAPNLDPSNINITLLLLSHDRPTSLGNIPIFTSVAAPAFLVEGMFGGKGGDCSSGVGCSTDDDCLSHQCNAQHVCETPAGFTGGATARTARRAP